jgi:hypothetical protein
MGRVKTLATDIHLNPGYSDAATGPSVVKNEWQKIGLTMRKAAPNQSAMIF